MSSISDITGYYDYGSVYGYSTGTTKGSTSAIALESTLNSTDLDTATDDELMDVCKSFEAYFVEQVMKEAKKMVQSDEDENTYLQYFGDTLLQEYSSMIVETGGLGIAEDLYESIKRNSGIC